ncbi:hypothetical protein AMK26_03875 [Streptomyces sp. CB03234]|uniref:hypothetical protein n=1 Tax=Streptomyces sp. (strain CB03234) TaxID=1703937 RepID=UPI00093DFFB1|nr:hypothetical protein [Streptomyces sp. CB03234]OKK08170.1 hypothetical protein AMK26_03875 [Streptomyces sp. CB03234]
MPEDLLNQQAGTVHEETARNAGKPGHTPDQPTEGDQPRDGAGTEGAMKLMTRQAEAIRAHVLQHSTEDFMQRLAARITSEARRPARIQYAPAGPAAGAHDPYPGETTEITQLPAPAAGPLPRTLRPDGRPQPRRPRARRRRPTPINTSDPAKSQYLAFGYVTELCSTVLRSAEIDTLAAFAADYDEAGARTFGCLLYSLDKRESAMYWWRFAAGAGDPLAAHLLAAHHAATGPSTDSRAWCAFSRMLGFRADRHVPKPVRHRTELAENFAREIPLRDETRLFMRYPHLPQGLAAR